MKVSVAMISYNHERFIAQALESVLRQRVNFPYEIVIGDDHSTDATASIIAEFHQRHPDKIVPFLREKNLGMAPNFMQTLASCRGQYVALLEGDDFWTSEDKLQRQADFLDANPDYAITGHRVQILNELGTNLDRPFPAPVAGTYSLDNLLTEPFIMTCSVVYRRDAVRRIPAWFADMKLNDWPLMALAAVSGKIQFLDDLMAVYRVHSGGTWSSRTQLQRLREMIRMLTALDAELGFRHTGRIRETVARFSLEWAQIAHAGRHRVEAGRAVVSCVRNGGWHLPGSRRTLVALGVYSLLGTRYKIQPGLKRAVSE